MVDSVVDDKFRLHVGAANDVYECPFIAHCIAKTNNGIRVDIQRWKGKLGNGT